METILADTSVWINIFKGIETKASVFLRENNNILVATCPTIVQEVLQGIVSDTDYQNISEYFNDIINLPSNGYGYARQAAKLYRDLRKMA
ncbi:hypothetical protein [Mucilaginibacter panaciglaebae]|uniref:PIN domain-containing protein n=1 Tax=Mucilaginibacter panaciglaebae TaxID=502331 RepID=A0ABP7WS60_9SPHI